MIPGLITPFQMQKQCWIHSIFNIQRINGLQFHRCFVILSHSIPILCKLNKGGIDNKNESTKYGKSLSKERRKRELQKITKQNHKILKRIQGARPTYNHKAWEEEARANDRILANICEFKPKFSLMKNEKMDHHLYDEDYLMDFDYESVGTEE